MKLKEYLFKKNITQKDFSEKLEIAPNYLHLIIAGKRRPSIALARKIESFTNGRVKKEEVLFPEDYPEDEI